MLSTTKVDYDKSNSQATWKNKPKSKNKNLNFACAPKSGGVLYQKIITSGKSQDRQIISIVESLPSYIQNKRYSSWAESIHRMERVDQDNCIPAIVNRRNYGTVIGCVFTWNADTWWIF